MTAEPTELDGLRALDPQAVSAIHHRFFPEIYRYARYRLGDEALAEDVAGEVFVRLLEAVSAGRGPRTNSRGWLLGTASHLVNDHLRHRYAHPTEELPEDVEPHADSLTPIQHAERAERGRSLRAALAKLTLEQQQVIALRFGGEYSLAETALIMRKKANTIKVLQFRALAALRRIFADEIP